MIDALPLSDPDVAPDLDLLDRLGAADRTVRARFDALDAEVAEVVAPLRARVAETAEAHGRLMEEYSFDLALDAPLRPPRELWEALTAYRRDAALLHDALQTSLRDFALGSVLGARFAEARTHLEALAGGAPEQVTRPEPDGLVEAEAGDSTALLARKLAERTRRRVRATGRTLVNGLRAVVRKERFPPHAHVQTVPLRSLLDEHAQVRLARLALEEHERVQTALGQAVARLEAALAAWTETVLNVESKLDRPRFHTEGRVWEAASPPPLAGPETSEADGSDAEPAQRTAPPDRTAEVRAVREAAQKLDATLRTLDFAVPAHKDEVIDVVQDALEERIRRSGYDSDPVATPGEDLPAEFAADVERWTAWHRSTAQRLGLDNLLLRLREHLLGEVEQLIQGVTRSTVRPVQKAADDATADLEALKAEAERTFAEARDALNPGALATELRNLLDRSIAEIDRDLFSTLQPISLDRAVDEAVGAARQRIGDLVATVPDHLTIRARLSPGQAGFLGPTADVDLRKIIGGLLTEEFAARLVKSADALRQPLFRALSDAEGVRDIVRYNLETAVEELDAAAAAGTRESIDEAIENARELTVDGLARSVERLHALTAPLAEPWQDFVRRATETFERGWNALRQRTNAQTLVEAQFLDFKTRLLQTAERSKAALLRADERAGHAVRRLFRLGRREAKRLVEMGQAAAGLAAQSASDRQRTLDALADAGRIHADLPLVYRRLFAFGSVGDPGLFVGQTAQLAHAAGQYERWCNGRDASALVVTAPAGGGRSSFVRVLEATTLADAEAVTLVLDGRLDTGDAFAQRLGAALGLDASAARTLDMLEAFLIAQDPPQRRVCLIEGLEHLILRTANGLDLLERVLIFMSRTDSHVFWIATVIESGWDFVERAAPQITGLVGTVALTPLGREQIEEVVMRRHRRSGLPLVFAEPAVPSPLLARRLGKTKTPDERQALLRTEFFDGLYRASGPHPLLTLLYWLRAADFEAEADTLTLRPVQPLDFGFVAQFDLPRAFALKALLQHGSLTLDEHDRIFRSTREESFLLFESLHNLRLIQRADGPEDGARRNGHVEAPEAVLETARYRLHPLAAAPIADALRARNML